MTLLTQIKASWTMRVLVKNMSNDIQAIWLERAICCHSAWAKQPLSCYDSSQCNSEALQR